MNSSSIGFNILCLSPSWTRSTPSSAPHHKLIPHYKSVTVCPRTKTVFFRTVPLVTSRSILVYVLSSPSTPSSANVFWCFSTVAPRFNLPQTTLTLLSKSLTARTPVSDVRFRPKTSILHDTDMLYSTPELLHPLLGPYRRKVYLYVGQMCFRR